MGGLGSGRRFQWGKDTTNDYRSLDVRWLKRHGYLDPGQSYSLSWSRGGNPTGSIWIRTEVDRLILDYRSKSYGGKWQKREYSVYLDWTACNLGGQRVWFLCPMPGCGRRVATLYGGANFACRHCHKLAYPSQRETGYDRSARRADRIREKLGWKTGIFNPPGWKPKGMHWRTYWRLKAKHDRLSLTSLDGIAEKLGLFGKKRNSSDLT